MKFTPATLAPSKEILIVIEDKTLTSKEFLIVHNSWTHPNDREIRKGVLNAKFKLQQSTWHPNLPYTVTGTRAELEQLKTELDNAYGLTMPEIANQE